MAKSKKEISFEDALDELVRITEMLERGDLSLSDSIEAYSRGMELKKICEERLKEAENKIEVLEKHGRQIKAKEVKSSDDDIPGKNQIQGTLL